MFVTNVVSCTTCTIAGYSPSEMTVHTFSSRRPERGRLVRRLSDSPIRPVLANPAAKPALGENSEPQQRRYSSGSAHKRRPSDGTASLSSSPAEHGVRFTELRGALMRMGVSVVHRKCIESFLEDKFPVIKDSVPPGPTNTTIWHKGDLFPYTIRGRRDSSTNSVILHIILNRLEQTGSTKIMKKLLRIQDATVRAMAMATPLHSTSSVSDVRSLEKEVFLTNFFRSKGVPHILPIQREDHHSRSGLPKRAYLTPLCESDLLDLVNDTWQNRGDISALEECFLLDIAFKILETLCGIHENQYCHLDIKLENILVEENEVYLIDYGLAGPFGEVFAQGGTPGYVAPEVYSSRDRATATPARDMWAFGVVLYELLYHEKPFAEVQANMKSCRYEESLFLQLRTSLLKSIEEVINGLKTSMRPIDLLIAEMLAENPDRRPSARLALDRLGQYLKQRHSVCSVIT